MSFKNALRRLLVYLHLDLTKNLEYDRLTKKLIRQALRRDSRCIDIGCHRGEILDLFINYAPDGIHLAFEPIPRLYNDLKVKYKNEDGVKIFDFALSDKQGEATFQYVKNAPAYSGLKKRQYKVKHPEIQEIEVKMRCLDDVLDPDQPVDFIKIDVEGAELGVLKGAKATLKKHKPLVVFECGLGASDYYGTRPEAIAALFGDVGMKLNTIRQYLHGENPLTTNEFVDLYVKNSEYYFIAC